MKAVTEATLGAWLVKASPGNLPVAELRQDGFGSLTSRCVRPTYRADLVAAGQPVLLWVSGQDPLLPAGIHAVGRTTGPVVHDAEVSMPVSLRAVEPAVLREELFAVPGLSGLEVLRMPAGSNPSYLDVTQWRTLRQAFPQVDIG